MDSGLNPGYSGHTVPFYNIPKLLTTVQWTFTIEMSNFMCQLDWAMGYPDVWLKINLSVYVSMFWGEINI